MVAANNDRKQTGSAMAYDVIDFSVKAREMAQVRNRIAEIDTRPGVS